MRARASSLIILPVIIASLALEGCSSAGSAPPATSASPTPTGAVAAASPLPTDPASGLPTAFDDAGMGELDAEDLVAGVDIAPGTYRTGALEIEDDGDRGALFDHSCKWRVREGGTSAFDGIVAAGNNDLGRPTFTLVEGQSVVSLRCGRWDLVDESTLFAGPEQAPTAIGDGIWLVGEDLAPGTWRANGTGDPEDPDEWCGWEVDTHWRDELAEIVELGLSQGEHHELVLETGQQLRSDGCDGWTRIAAPPA
ncbi:hypothetical protein [Demequina gelatinilytica]|uniref:hypothetical protein n=1 Tax=Demequina gelatinilytica TaxID=1638980 RepID=UPI0007825042|nr:hypothetical protein [Demequina gelatinilytica]